MIGPLPHLPLSAPTNQRARCSQVWVSQCSSLAAIESQARVWKRTCLCCFFFFPPPFSSLLPFLRFPPSCVPSFPPIRPSFPRVSACPSRNSTRLIERQNDLITSPPVLNYLRQVSVRTPV
ncbi:hypothetical protein O3P69_015228 [Scylla paramamosain]|uniref:Uncharacterized protein n=1 Tax=Scylla paramamosain TaxID=85552 RepID=A0AAW0T4C0_SCYPA